MYGLFTFIHHEFMVNVAKYTIHGSYGLTLFTPKTHHFEHRKLFEDGWEVARGLNNGSWEWKQEAKRQNKRPEPYGKTFRKIKGGIVYCLGILAHLVRRWARGVEKARYLGSNTILSFGELIGSLAVA